MDLFKLKKTSLYNLPSVLDSTAKLFSRVAGGDAEFKWISCQIRSALDALVQHLQYPLILMLCQFRHIDATFCRNPFLGFWICGPMPS